jgi:hypothetical protein
MRNKKKSGAVQGSLELKFLEPRFLELKFHEILLRG